MININKKSGFTLIELLIVIGILAIIAVALLVTLNPAEAQRKARDSQRLKQMSELQAVVEQYVADNPTSGFTAVSTANSGSNACTTAGWMGTDVCSYQNVLVVDPANKSTNFINSAGVSSSGYVAYQVLVSAGNYRICTKLESKGNASRLTSDGSADNYYEVYNNTAAGGCTF